MSVIQTIRDKGAWILFTFIALALIAFIMQDSSLGGPSNSVYQCDIGNVNGDEY